MMKKNRFLPAFCWALLPLSLSLASHAGTHGTAGRENPADKTAKVEKVSEPTVQREQRRHDLRMALAQRKRSDDAIEAKLAERHLSAQERAELRQQLRQQQRQQVSP